MGLLENRLIDYIPKRFNLETIKRNKKRYLLFLTLNIFLSLSCLFNFGITTLGIIYFIIMQVLLLITVVDYYYYIIPDLFNIIILICGITITIFITKEPLLHLLSIAFTIGLIGLFFILYKIFNKEYMGGGDLKYLVAVGLVAGLPKLILIIALASLISFVIEVAIKKIVLKKDNNVFAFGPYLVIGTIITLYYGDVIIKLYLNYGV